MTRDISSRPISSVPIQCASDGPMRIAFQSVAIGEYGATSEAASAVARKISTRTSPTMPERWRRKRRSPRRNGLRTGAACGAVAMVALIRRAALG